MVEQDIDWGRLFDDEEGSYVVFGDNRSILKNLPAESINMIYIDPPFNTGKSQARTELQTSRDAEGDRIGFKGQRYRSEVVAQRSYQDEFDDYLAFLEPRLIEAHRVLTPDGALYFHIDYREVHYCKILLDDIFGRNNFLNEIIWAYDYGGKTTKKWPAKHDNILYYAKDSRNYVFNAAEVDRIPYMAPGLVTEEKAERGKMPTDTWWHTIVSPTGKEKTGYPTQKPMGILRRMVIASSKPGDLVLDFFAGSGTTGMVAQELGRRFVMVDSNPEALEVMYTRMVDLEVEFFGWPEGQQAIKGDVS